MLKGFFKVPQPVNEPILNYAPASRERQLLQNALKEARSEVIDIPMYIGGKEIYTDNKVKIKPPHDHQHLLGTYNQGTKQHVSDAITAALAAN